MKKLLFFSLIFLCIYAAGCKNEEKVDPVTPSQQKTFGYLPGDTQFLLYANLSSLRNSEFWDGFIKNSLQGRNSTSWLYNFENQTGLGLGHGVKEIFLATTWKGINAVAVNFSGSFKKVKGFFNAGNGFEAAGYHNVKYYHLKKNKKSVFVFKDDSTLLILNNEKYLKRQIDGETKVLSENSNFMNIVGEIKNKNYYWFATDKGSYAAEIVKLVMGANKALPAKKLISSIKSITLSAKFDGDVSVESGLGCANSADAYLLSSAIKSAIAMDIIQSRNPLIGKLVERAAIKRISNKIKLNLNLSRDDIESLRILAKKNNIDKKL